MTEAQLTRRELKKIRNRWPSAFVWKINEKVTAGIPDALLVNGAHSRATVWVEFKRPTSMTMFIESMLTPLQRQTMLRLTRQNQDVLLVGFRPDRTQEIFKMYPDGTFGRSVAESLENWLESSW